MSRPAAKSTPAAKPTSPPSTSTSTPPPEKETKINLDELYSQHPIQYAIRSKHGVNFRRGPLSTIQPETNVEYKPCDDAGLIYSSDGSLVALIDKDVVDIYETKEYKRVQQIPRPAVGHAYFSSHHTYLITWERRSERRAQGATQPEQLRVWRISDGTCIFIAHQKDLTPESSPLQWSHDERIMLHIVSNEIRCYQVPDDGNIPDKWNFTHKLHVQGVTSFAIAPVVLPYLIAVFVPAKGTDPARVHIYRYPKLDADAHIASKSFYKAEEVSLKWSPLGHALLIEASTSTDKTGKSYYGESNLHLLHADGSFQCTVPFGTNAGPIQDVAWSPAGKEFLVIQGFQPAKSLLFLASNCTPIRDFGTASRNTIRWSPHGRFVCIAGFGNLAGEMDFWDNNKFKKLGSCQDRNGAKSYEWTPDSRHFITAVLRPWRRVDNGYKIWTYYGEMIYQENYDELYQVVPQPSLPTIYPNRPMSPRLKSREVVEAKKETETKPSAYVPPHLRGTGKTSTIMAREVTAGPRKLTQLEQSLLRDPNAKPIATATPQMSRDEYRKLKKKEQRKKKAEAAHEEPEPEPEPEAKAEVPEVSTESLSKNPKVIQKKLKQIESLKEQLASGQPLDTQAMAKIAQEDMLRKHLEALTLEATTV